MLHRQSYAALREKYASGEISPVDVALSALNHAEEVNRKFNAFALIDRDRALFDAEQSAKRWKAGRSNSLLDGMPITVKEFASVAGWPIRRGSLLSSPLPASDNAVFVSRLIEAGVVFIGKTRAPEFNWKGVTDSPGFGITSNPVDARLTPGGSSGGCAAAVAAGVVRVSIGSDAGGSVRIPAAFTGTIGLKPTFGRIPLTPFPSTFFNVVHTGPIAASMTDLSEVLSVIAGPTGQDWSSVGMGALNAPGSTPQKLKIGLLTPEQWNDSDDSVKQGMSEMLSILRQGGFSVPEVAYDVKAASKTGEFLYRMGCVATIKNVPEKDRSQIDQGLLRFVEKAQHSGLQEVLSALRARDEHSVKLGALFDDVDVLMLPTMPIPAFEAGKNVPSGWKSDDWMSWNPYTPAFNLTHAPALSYPIWPAGFRLPIGVQFVASKAREDVLISLGSWLEERVPVRIMK